MRVVIDTNTLISAAMKHDTPPRIAVIWVRDNGCLLKSAQTEAECLRIMAKPALARFLDGEFCGQMRALLARAELVSITTPIRACIDPDDDRILELAVSGRADAIVSGDRDLLVLHPFRDIPILSAAGFLDFIMTTRRIS